MRIKFQLQGRPHLTQTQLPEHGTLTALSRHAHGTLTARSHSQLAR